MSNVHVCAGCCMARHSDEGACGSRSITHTHPTLGPLGSLWNVGEAAISLCYIHVASPGLYCVLYFCRKKECVAH
jgi:hypothetical protein